MPVYAIFGTLSILEPKRICQIVGGDVIEGCRITYHTLTPHCLPVKKSEHKGKVAEGLYKPFYH